MIGACSSGDGVFVYCDFWRSRRGSLSWVDAAATPWLVRPIRLLAVLSLTRMLTSQQTSRRLCRVPDREETMFIKNTWYVAGWSKEVPQDGFLARTILGLPLALWRDQADKVVAFENMCCHRGAPLSRGRREGDTVRCLYHGLLFDRA